MGKLVDVDKFLKKVKKDREHEIYLHSWTADMVLERLNSWYAPSAEAISKADYETRLKADMVAMLTDIQLEIKELDTYDIERTHGLIEDAYVTTDVNDIIQRRIDKLKENKDEK